MKNQKGIALLVTLFAITIMIFLATEIGYNTQVELAIGASQIDRLKAYYLAKSGIQISLLRIHVYKSVMQKFGGQLGNNKAALDVIWQLPFSWPPMIPDDNISSMDKEQLKDAIDKSYIDGTFSTKIEGEGSKIDLNDLGSPSEQLRKSVSVQLNQILQNRLEADDEWAKENRGLKAQEIVNNIADWIDDDSESFNGGSESQYYSRTDPPIKPPNRPMKTLEELHMVAGVTDEIFNLLSPRVTVYGTKGINVNLASAEVIRSIDPQITKEISAAVIEKRNDPNQGPFGNAGEFLSFVQSKGVRADKFNKDPEIPLLFDAEYNFRITSNGFYKKAQREIIAIVYDFDKVKGQIATLLASASQAGAQQQQQQGAAASSSPSPAHAAPAQTSGTSGPPHIIFWQEF